MIKIPKLTTATAEKVDEAESNFEPVPEDVYVAALVDVEVKEGAKGTYWKWTFKIAEGDFKGRQQWTNTSLNENALWKLREVFEAFGVPTDSDTDDLVGNQVKLYVVQEPIEQGSRKGQMGNQIRTVMPLEQLTADSKSKTKSKASASKGVSADEPALF